MKHIIICLCILVLPIAAYCCSATNTDLVRHLGLGSVYPGSVIDDAAKNKEDTFYCEYRVVSEYTGIFALTHKKIATKAIAYYDSTNAEVIIEPIGNQFNLDKDFPSQLLICILLFIFLAAIGGSIKQLRELSILFLALAFIFGLVVFFDNILPSNTQIVFFIGLNSVIFLVTFYLSKKIFN